MVFSRGLNHDTEYTCYYLRKVIHFFYSILNLCKV
jgi:hypothetical protein